jgi:hypothetical protein
MDRFNPCWQASNAPDDDPKHQIFNVTQSFGTVFAQGDAEVPDLKDVDMPPTKLKPTLVDNASVTTFCTAAYQMNLIDPGDQIVDVFPPFADIFKSLTKSVDELSWADRITNFTIFAPLGILFQLAFTTVSRIVTFVVSNFYTFNQKLAGEATQRVAFNIANMVCMGGLDRIKKIWDYQAAYNFQTQIPTPDLATAAFLGNEIDECTFQAYVMGGDYRWEPYRKCIQAQKLKFTALELKTLDKRNKLARSDLTTRLRELGSLHTEDAAEIDALFTQIPTAGDIIRYMVRDTDNEKVTTLFQTKEGFDQNYIGKLKDFGDMQGLTNEHMIREWQAHWSIPSPTQLYEMLHRLRHADDKGGIKDVNEAVRTALKQQDILPYWIEPLMKISYHPLTRTDLNRAYDRGWINDDDYITGMYNNGYSDEDAQTLLKFAQKERILAIKNSDFGRHYIDGYIDMEQTMELAGTEGFDPGLQDQIQGILDPLRDVNLQRKRVEALVRQYKRCWISREDFITDAEQLDIPPDVIRWQLSWAQDDTTCGSRRESAANLCLALDQNIISSKEYVDRMKLLRFDDHAINTYLSLCQNKIAAAKAKAEAAAQKAADQAEKKAEQAAQKAAQQAASAMKRAARQAATLERKRQARNKLLEDAANRLGEYLSDVAGPPSTLVTGLYHELQFTFQLSQDESASILAMASTKAKGMNQAEFMQWVTEIAATSLKEPWISIFPTPITLNGHP